MTVVMSQLSVLRDPSTGEKREEILVQRADERSGTSKNSHV